MKEVTVTLFKRNDRGFEVLGVPYRSSPLTSGEFFENRVSCFDTESFCVSVADEATAEEIAEEVFDLTNNPSRDNPCDFTLSVGDVVRVQVECGQSVFERPAMLCLSRGWADLGSYNEHLRAREALKSAA